MKYFFRNFFKNYKNRLIFQNFLKNFLFFLNLFFSGKNLFLKYFFETFFKIKTLSFLFFIFSVIFFIEPFDKEHHTKRFPKRKKHHPPQKNPPDPPKKNPPQSQNFLFSLFFSKKIYFLKYFFETFLIIEKKH